MSYLGLRVQAIGALASFIVVCSGLPLRSASPADCIVYLGDPNVDIAVDHHQAWGDFGFNVATARSGGRGAPLRIGTTVFPRGLGHHANGSISITLNGQYTRFLAELGVQWQGGGRGSVVFQIVVDGETRFATEPLSDSDAPVPVDIPLDDAQQLELISNDAGDGIACDMANWIDARLVADGARPRFGALQVETDVEHRTPLAATESGFTFVATPAGVQFAIIESLGHVVVAIDRSEHAAWTVPVTHLPGQIRVLVDARLLEGDTAAAEVVCGQQRSSRLLNRDETATLTVTLQSTDIGSDLCFLSHGSSAEAGVDWSNLRFQHQGRVFPVRLMYTANQQQIPPPQMPDFKPVIEQLLIEWDWRLQDGIGTVREPRSWEAALVATLDRGDQLLAYLAERGLRLGDLPAGWQNLHARFEALARDPASTDIAWQQLWRDTHRHRREIVLANPCVNLVPLAFVKRVPSSFSHQLSQYAGRRARPGGGVFVLSEPGKAMRTRRLELLPEGSYLHLDVSWDGQQLLFSHCETRPKAESWLDNQEQHYHLYRVNADGSSLTRLTDGPYDDFSPRFLPNGDILLISTRRGGYHRCGRGPCPVYTMALLDPGQGQPRVISFHETHEWDPAVLNDGRVIYTRWDYVDRHAVHYQQLWSIRPDGSDVQAYYGNNTWNPVGVWEARPVPGSSLVMATAAAHHAMTAGSIILLDITRGRDGLAPIERLTPDVRFPESEAAVQHWHATAGVQVPSTPTVEERRWPGHCYRSPYPLTEDFFLAAYSYQGLVGEPLANSPNMFGLYLVDRFGNKELLYRDLSISSQWPTPLVARALPPMLPSREQDVEHSEGTFVLQDVYNSWPHLAAENEPVRQLRIVQVLPKTTPHINNPRVGLANASPGRQVLGTVPVEADGSAYFRAPAGIPLAFQALDEHGMAIQTMRSLTNLQPGEQQGCIGCHEHRRLAPGTSAIPLALQREPSPIFPAVEGSKPFNYAILVQPVLDRHCVSCHDSEDPAGGVALTGEPDGAFTRSYNALAPHVSFSQWQGTPQSNREPLTHPGQFGARSSALTRLLQKGHEDVRLTQQDWQRLIVWMDTNALFYGTFDPADQRRQQRGERIAGPVLE